MNVEHVLLEALEGLLAMDHYSYGEGSGLGDPCSGKECLHSCGDSPPFTRKHYPYKNHGPRGGCVQVTFPDGSTEWHDRNCVWAIAQAAFEKARGA